MVCGARPRFGRGCGRSGRCEVAQVTGGLGFTTRWVHAHTPPRHGREGVSGLHGHLGGGRQALETSCPAAGSRSPGSRWPTVPPTQWTERSACPPRGPQPCAETPGPIPQPQPGIASAHSDIVCVRQCQGQQPGGGGAALGTLRVRGAVRWRVMRADCDRHYCPLEPPGQRASVHGYVTWPQESEGQAKVTAQSGPGGTGSGRLPRRRAPSLVGGLRLWFSNFP